MKGNVMEKIYLQMASYKMCQSTLTYEEQLQCTAKMGYDGIELGGLEYSAMDAGVLKQMAACYGLEIISAHINADHPLEMLDYLEKLGVERAVISSYTFSTEEETVAFAHTLSQWGNIFKAHRITLGYHNHTQEFYRPAGASETLHEILLESTDPDAVKFQLDAGWAACAGMNVLSYLEKYQGRFNMMHITESDRIFGAEKPVFLKRDEQGRIIADESFKQLQADKRAANCRLGLGINDWRTLINAGRIAQIPIFINERRHSYNEDLLTSLNEDIAFLKSI